MSKRVVTEKIYNKVRARSSIDSTIELARWFHLSERTIRYIKASQTYKGYTREQNIIVGLGPEVYIGYIAPPFWVRLGEKIGFKKK